MKNRYLYIALCAAGLLSGATSCNDYLETSSPSTVDKEFVFSTTTTKWAALEGAKKSMMNAYTLLAARVLVALRSPQHQLWLQRSFGTLFIGAALLLSAFRRST